MSCTARVPHLIVQPHTKAIATCRVAGNRAGELAAVSRQLLPKPQSTHQPSYLLSSFAYAASQQERQQPPPYLSYLPLMRLAPDRAIQEPQATGIGGFL
jgi:hypothetical protein